GWRKGPILILCGPGNNGGDGFVAARHLARAGAQVAAVLVSSNANPSTADATRNWNRRDNEPRVSRIHVSTGLELKVLAKDVDRASVVVDGLLGTGVHGELRDPIRSAVELILRARAAKVPIVAVDTPTAVDLTSGDPSEPVVHADLTVTFHRPKTGLLTRRCAALAGKAMGSWEEVETRVAVSSGRAPSAPRTTEPAWRREALRALADERFDVLIVGGGIVGAGALLDATSRGLRAALVEQRDIASGTSGRSSRLIHGGLRYLEQLHFGLVYEALQERARLLRLAPHLVTLEPFLFPIYGIPLLQQGFYGSGIFLYDLLGARRDGGFAKHLRPRSAIEYAPELRRRGLTGGIIYHDGVEDDARLALAVLRTALAGGAVAGTRVHA